MLKAYEYRIYPTSQQEEIFNKTLGLCRLYWNIVVFNRAIESFINELRSYHKCLAPSELKEDILIRSLIKQLEEIRIAPYDYEAADKAHLEEIHRFGHRPPRF